MSITNSTNTTNIQFHLYNIIFTPINVSISKDTIYVSHINIHKRIHVYLVSGITGQVSSDFYIYHLCTVCSHVYIRYMLYVVYVHLKCGKLVETACLSVDVLMLLCIASKQYQNAGHEKLGFHSIARTIVSRLFSAVLGCSSAENIRSLYVTQISF